MDTCVSAIDVAVHMVPDTHEIVDQHIIEKDILATNSFNKVVLAYSCCVSWWRDSVVRYEIR